MGAFEDRERQAGLKASRILRQELRSEIQKLNFNTVSGRMAKTNVASKLLYGRLDRLVITTPYWSVKKNYGSDKTGKTKAKTRSGGPVKPFVRQYQGKATLVKAHIRKAALIPEHNKGIDYKATEHLSNAIRNSNVLEILATDLAENRAVEVVSKIHL